MNLVKVKVTNKKLCKKQSKDINILSFSTFILLPQDTLCFGLRLEVFTFISANPVETLYNSYFQAYIHKFQLKQFNKLE